MNKRLYARLAAQNMRKNAQFYVPYLLTILCTVAAFYITCTLARADDLPGNLRYAYLSAFMSIGYWVIGFFAVIFLFYTNSFLMKRRKKELGLYNVLGLGKRHIACMLGMETLYVAVMGIVGGIVLGMLLQKLLTLILFRLMHFSNGFSFYVSGKAIGTTVLLFCVILFVGLLDNLRRIHVQNPLETMREGSAGEREPKTRWLLTLIGVAALVGGYAIALYVRDALEAFAWYFVAVFLVIIGTYCLFTAVSITVLKALRANKKFYYRPRAFITISGMLYRMKRNAVGLANICILSTMVLVMVSGTVSLFLGTHDLIEQRYPGDINIEVRYAPNAEDPFQPDAMLDTIEQGIRTQGLEPENVRTLSYTKLQMFRREDGSLEVTANQGNDTLLVLTAQEYSRFTGKSIPQLAANEVIVSAERPAGDSLTLHFMGGTRDETVTYRVRRAEVSQVSLPEASVGETVQLIVADESVRQAMAEGLVAPEEFVSFLRWEAYVDTNGTEEQQTACVQDISDWNAFAGDVQTGSWGFYRVEGKAAQGSDAYALNGGFFFLGLFLGLVFLLAAALILYYKQVSEGYEDCERYRIMQNVGLEKKMVRRSVNAQILVVFFLPLLVAAVHVAFDFRLMTYLLTLFGLKNTGLTLACTGASFLGFALVYGVVYWLTARVYYRIVQ
ncbi:MAG: ABC transporter permease [Butyricicoccus sp.]|nr:ABC transporter permease [Butyricicoccus sp.]